jgi:hypothetical protein
LGWAGLVVTETDLVLSDERTLHVYDTGTGDAAAGFAVFWHHGTPNTGAPPEPLMTAAARRGIRWVSHDRPDTADRRLSQAGKWRRRLPTSPASPMRWASTGSRS